ncbi:Prophage antirepressor [Thalassospira xiamenensis M-5 = DSM 17429]|uniref:Bro-N domain-containing protein n=1 Tax=Thalassospira xiamenensis M-5 = DSM 17429 TaxID=1123366 RepID=A0AB72U7V3_9PROT|nr:Bro-N domain-containing protein [Thalassospira xiamenensis]AJD50288.1 hypothetical protein TH3_00810 [Thalassospira xiamenensis M-5 = DSM 17429]SIT32796.1 Prophage antirepressor [Thalassospira xiamenensis M-5 = DSM 17429]
MSEIITFNFDSVDFRAIEIDGQIWAVGTDVCKALGYRDAENGLRNLDDDEKGTHIVRTAGGDQNLQIINESGLYSLILRSRKPEAKRFKKWVTSEVLPSIRKTGAYHHAQTTPPAPNTDQQELIEALLDKVSLLEENRSLVKGRITHDKFQGVARQLFEKTDFDDETIAEILAPGIGTFMPEWVSWQRRRH